MRLSPTIKFEGLDDADGLKMGLYMAGQLADRSLGYFHLCEPDWAGGRRWMTSSAPRYANPDLPERLFVGGELNEVQFDLVYGGNEAGYTDYPAMESVH